MGDGYYPKYYQKKKHRDQMFLNIGRVVLLVLLLGVGYLVGATAFSIYPMGRKQQQVSDLAERKEQLEVQKEEKLTAQDEVAGTSRVSNPSTTPPKANLAEIGYAVSQPSVHVTIEGVTAGESKDPHTIDDAPGDTPTNGAADTSGQNETDADEKRDPPKDPNRISRNNDGADSGSNPGKTTEGDKPSSATNDKPTDKPKEATPTTEPKKDDPKPAEKPTEEPKPTVKPKGSVTYKVFAGYYYTRDEAVSRKKDLSNLGFSGTVLEGAGSLSIFVSELENSDSARALQAKLTANGFPDAFVVHWQN